MDQLPIDQDEQEARNLDRAAATIRLRDREPEADTTTGTPGGAAPAAATPGREQRPAA